MISSFIGKYSVTGQEPGARYTKASSAEGGMFASVLMDSQKTDMSNVEIYKKQLEMRFGNINVQSVKCAQESIDSLGASLSGTGNIIIASNILEEMANQPKKAAYYEQKIQYYFTDVLPQSKKFMAAVDMNITVSGVVIHPDGEVRYICGCEESPEKRARAEAEKKLEKDKEMEQQRKDEKWREAAAERRTKDMLLMQRIRGAGELLVMEKLVDLTSMSVFGKIK